MKKFIAPIAAISTAAVLTLSASAVTLDKDLGIGWSASVTVAADEFADLTTDTTVTITYTVNKDLAEMEGQDYWCIKPMVNDAGWPFITGLNGLTLSESGDSYTIDPETTSISFTFPEDQVDLVKNAGMAFMGHGIKLEEMTFAEGAVTVTPAESNTDTAPAENSTPVVSDSKGSPDTGVAGIGAVLGAAALGLSAMVITKKRK